MDALSTLKEVEVIGICDINPNAAGLALAKKLKVRAFYDYRDLLWQPGLNLVFEVTGSDLVREAVHKDCPATVEIVDARVAKLMMDLFEELLETNRKLKMEITERKKVEEALRQSNEKLTELDELKTDFLSTVSHELRTPLTSVLGFAKITQKRLEEHIFPLIISTDRRIEKTVKQVKDNLEIIVSEGERLTELINDVLDIAKLEAGKIEWKMEKLSMADVIERATAASSYLFEQKGLAFFKEIEEGLPDLTGDRDRLIQVIINLISNAVKFTNEGSVTCRARMIGDEITVSVIDTGIGIAREDHERIFEKFKQAGETLTDKPKGTGLGLAICKQIVEHHGGRIWVESEPGKGSSFSFALPVSRQADVLVRTVDIDSLVKQLKDRVVTVAPAHFEGRKNILVVDDDAHIRALLRQELEGVGYRVREAKDGMEAICVAKKEKPDLIILDVMMPKMSGFDVAAVLRNDPDTMGIPIIILSIIEDRERGYRIGIDSYFTKPVDSEKLLNEIGLLMSRGCSKKKVLVVDEDESAVKTLTEVLEAKGYTVVAVNDLEGCIKLASEEKPDMIIIDALFSDYSDVVKTLRFEKGLENIFFFLLGEGKGDSTGN